MTTLPEEGFCVLFLKLVMGRDVTQLPVHTSGLIGHHQHGLPTISLLQLPM
jgi:hypothetical protein